MLKNMGYDVEMPNGVVDIEIDVDDLERFIINDRYFSGIFTKYLGGDYFNHYYDYDEWSYVNYNKENENIILGLIRGHVESGDAGDMTIDDLDGVSFESILKNYMSQDLYDYTLRDIINQSYQDCLNDAQYKAVIRGIRNALEEYGEVKQLNDEGVIISVDVLKILSANMNDDVIDSTLDEADGDLVYAFKHAVTEGYIDKPRLDIYENFYCESDNFNEILSDRLGEL